MSSIAQETSIAYTSEQITALSGPQSSPLIFKSSNSEQDALAPPSCSFFLFAHCRNTNICQVVKEKLLEIQSPVSRQISSLLLCN